MSLLTLWAECGFRLRPRRNNQRGFFLLEALVLSFLVLGCGASVAAYRALAESRVSAGAEITAAYLAQEQNAWDGSLVWGGNGGFGTERHAV